MNTEIKYTSNVGAKIDKKKKESLTTGTTRNSRLV